MNSALTDDELLLLRRIAEVQEAEVVDFCIELDIVPDEPFVVDDVVDRVTEALLERAGREGLPLSKYDADDLRRFSAAELAGLARGVGARPANGAGPDRVIDQIIKASRKAHRKLPRRSQIPLMLTYFLPAVVRRLAAV
jgi:hypothetical protein